jgi:NAD(P)-dependent dehydrogenase (short-subunit alcohol dehydrogenase family)
MKDLSEKVAFITGGASGIGLGIAKACAKYGMKVVIADMRQDALDEAMKYFKEKALPVHPIKLDVNDRVAYARAADETEKIFGKIHVLVCNAGVGCGGWAERTTFQDWDYSIGVNITGVANGLVIILPRILKHGEGGHVVATSSVFGIAAVRHSIVYCTTKFAVMGMMESLATDLQDKNIGASVLTPGPIVTNLWLSSEVNRPASLRNEGQASPLLGKDGLPQPPPYDFSTFMDPVETGERVIRGIRRNDLFIITHPEYKECIIARNEALLRACPDEPWNEKRRDLFKKMGIFYVNPVYDKQAQVGPPDWT